MKINEKNIYNNKMKVILLCVLIINIILMIFLIYNYNRLNKDTIVRPMVYDNSNEKLGFDNLQEPLKATRNSDDLSIGKISKSIENFSNKFLTYLTQNVLQKDEEYYQKFFEENKNYIYQYSGIENEKDFLDFCNELKKSEINVNEIIKVSFIDGTSEYSNNVFKCDFRLIDKNNNSIILRITTSRKYQNRYKYQVIKE